jgi:hypothetical protein
MRVPRANILQPHLTPEDNQLNLNRTMIQSEMGFFFRPRCHFLRRGRIVDKGEWEKGRKGGMAWQFIWILGIAAWRFCFCICFLCCSCVFVWCFVAVEEDGVDLDFVLLAFLGRDFD